MGLFFYVRLLAGLILAGATTLGSAQDYAARSMISAVVANAFSKLSDQARLDVLPPELRSESAIYLQRRLGAWQERDARGVLGEPRKRRDAYEEGAVTGDIFSFRDPTNRYREFELLFDRQTKILRSAFIYPWSMTWNECRELWGAQVNTTVLSNGNIFRSYLNRRLDVLVDKNGTVINLGIY